MQKNSYENSEKTYYEGSKPFWTLKHAIKNSINNIMNLVLEKQNRKAEINPSTHGNLVYDKDNISTHQGKHELSNNWVLKR